MVSPSGLDPQRTAWWGMTVAVVAMGVMVLYSFVGTFVFGVFIYYATRKLYDRVRVHVESDSVAAVASLALFAFPVVLLLAYTTAIGLQEVGRFVQTVDIGPYEERLAPYIDVSTVVAEPTTLLRRADASIVRVTLQRTLDSIRFAFMLFLHSFLMFALAFYLLRDGDRITDWFRDQFGTDGGTLDLCMEAVDADLEAIFFGTILSAILTAAIGAIVYSFLGVFAPRGTAIPYPALLGLLIGAASLIPAVGTKLVYVPTTIFLLTDRTADGDIPVVFAGAFFLISLVLIDVVPDMLIRPYVSARRLHVGLVMFAYVLGPLLFGWYGIFLGPILLVLGAHVVYYILPPLLTGDPV